MSMKLKIEDSKEYYWNQNLEGNKLPNAFAQGHSCKFFFSLESTSVKRSFFQVEDHQRSCNSCIKFSKSNSLKVPIFKTVEDHCCYYKYLSYKKVRNLLYRCSTIGVMCFCLHIKKGISAENFFNATSLKTKTKNPIRSISVSDYEIF